MNVKRFFVAIGSPLLIATLLSSFLPFKAIPIFLGVALVIFSTYFIIIKKENRIFLIVALIISMYGISIYSYRITNEVIPIKKLSGESAEVVAQITDIISEGGKNSYLMKIVEHPFNGVPKKFNARLYSTVTLNLDCYDTIKTKVKFSSINNTTTFNASNMFQADNIYIFAFLSSDSIEITKNRLKPITHYLKIANNFVSEKLDIYLPEKNAQIVKSMLLGDKKEFNQEMSYNLSKAGIIHITAVSGLHVSLIASGIILIFQCFNVRKRSYAIISIILVWIFIIFSGLSFSAIRAGIMFTIIQSGHLFGKISDPLNSLFLSGFLIILFNPFAILDLGFLLTFSCTFGIVCVSPKVSNALFAKFPIKNRIVKSLINSIIISLSIMICCTPALYNISKGISLATPLANLIAIPLTTIVIVLSIISSLVFLIPFPMLYTGFTEALKLLTNIIIKFSEVFANIDWLYIGLDFAVAKYLIIAGCCCLIFAYLFNYKAIAKVALSLVAIIILVPLSHQIFAYNNTNIASFSTYDGGYVIVTQRGVASIFLLSSDKYCSTSIAKYLDGKNIHRVDKLVILEENTKTLNHILPLIRLIDVDKIYINGKNEFAGQLGSTTLESGKTEAIDELTRIIDGNSAVIEHNKVSVHITPSAELAKSIECKFLIFTDALQQGLDIDYKSKYVIGLNCDDKHFNNIVCAKENQTEITILPNGRTFLRKSKL